MSAILAGVEVEGEAAEGSCVDGCSIGGLVG